jgi:hypothetical protein
VVAWDRSTTSVTRRPSSPAPPPAWGSPHLVFYYDSDAPSFNGIVRIGQFDDDTNAIERQDEDFSVTIERAE